MGNTAGIGEQEESHGCWGRAGLQLGDAADPGGKNSELTSSSFVLRSSRARIRAELGGWAWIFVRGMSIRSRNRDGDRAAAGSSFPPEGCWK